MTIFTMNDVRGEINGRAMRVSDHALGLVVSISYGFMVGTYWADKAERLDAKALAVQFEETIPALASRSKSGRNGYIAMGQKFAAHLVKRFGNGAGVERSAVWLAVQACETISEAVDLLMVHVKVDMGCATYSDLAAELSPDKPQAAPKPFAERVENMATKGLESGEVSPADIRLAIDNLRLMLAAIDSADHLAEHSAIMGAAKAAIAERHDAADYAAAIVDRERAVRIAA